MSATWQGRLQETTCADDVIAVCREFVSVTTAQELADLPSDCKPSDFASPRDVQRYALDLIHALAIGDRSSAPTITRLSTFFTRAALRLVQLATDKQPQRRRA